MPRHRNSHWRALTNVNGLDVPNVDANVKAGAVIFVPGALPEWAEPFFELAESDRVEEIDAENLRELLEQARSDRKHAIDQLELVRAESRRQVEMLDAQGEKIAGVLAELDDKSSALENALREVEALRAELNRLSPGPLAERVGALKPRDLLARVNRVRKARDEEPFGGQGASARAREWLLGVAPTDESIVEAVFGADG